MNTLFLEMRGCNFLKTDPVCNESDVGTFPVQLDGIICRLSKRTPCGSRARKSRIACRAFS